MKIKIAFILLISIICGFVILSDDNDELGIKHVVSNKHETVNMLNDSIMQVGDTTINIALWIVPNPETIEIFISEDSIDLSAVISKDDGSLTTKREAIIYLGKCFFFDRTGNRKSSCEDSCHSLEGSGTGFSNKAQGGGMEFHHRSTLFKWWTGNESYVALDKKPFKNFSVLNAFRLHQYGTILSHALEFLFPLEGQIGKAMEAHFVGDAVLQCQQVTLYNRIAYAIYGRPLDESIFNQAISAFEQTLTTYDNNINKIQRGESNKLYYADAFIGLNNDCAGCHQTHTKSKSKAINPVHDIVKATGLDLNNAYHKGFFHTSDNVSFNSAIHMCAVSEGVGITTTESRTYAATIRNNLTDKNYN